MDDITKKFLGIKSSNPGHKVKGMDFVGSHQSGKKNVKYEEDMKSRSSSVYKRRSTLFKKANELSVVGDMEVFVYVKSKKTNVAHFWGTPGASSKFLPDKKPMDQVQTITGGQEESTVVPVPEVTYQFLTYYII